MTTFNRLHVQGFRRLADLDIELRPLCVAIGANGCGKTSLLDVFAMLASSTKGELENSIRNLGGLASCMTSDGRQQLRLQIAGRIERESGLSQSIGDEFDYELELSQFGIRYGITKEVLRRQLGNSLPAQELIRTKFIDVSYYNEPSVLDTLLGIENAEKLPEYVSPSWPYNFNETALGQAPKQYSMVNSFRHALASCTYYKAVDVGLRSQMRLPQPLRPANSPGRDGEDLLACLYTMREEHRDRFEAVEDTLRAAFHHFEKLELPIVASGMVALAWKDASFSRSFYANQLGDGMLRFLWLVTLLQCPGLTAVTLIDEPEVSLHPELLALLADLFREASARTQLIVATHSDRLVRFLEPKEVLAFDVAEDGTTTAKWADEHDLDQWLADYTLDEVWRMGRIGGRS
jgi:predicted ATPase